MVTVVIPNHKRVVILYNDKTQCFEVQHCGIILTRGQLGMCEYFCEIHEYEVTNRGDLNLIKYSNMPLPEVG